MIGQIKFFMEMTHFMQELHRKLALVLEIIHGEPHERESAKSGQDRQGRQASTDMRLEAICFRSTSDFLTLATEERQAYSASQEQILYWKLRPT
mmetsp:Transcript_1650/g.5009  ORF Transcript_1650/g.5009 Transcript_1650/m.5009 type:complete len:94 (+) Transcript_1650:543-824(+)